MPERPFASARTKRFREATLSVFNEEKISDIEQYGWQGLHVAGTEDGPSFSYTIGLFDTCGQPEIIEIGLRQNTANALLNEAARRLQAGLDLSRGRQSGLINGVDCEFRIVDPKWARRVMLGANWFYRDDEYPVLQAVYPDLNNRFPEDPGLDPSFAQPLLQPSAPFTSLEEKFWFYMEPKPRR